MNAPYRADQVGSLLRPDWLAEARQRFKAGALDAEELRATEDRAIVEAVRRQEDVGLESITDGEFRRDWWHLDFLACLDGVTLRENPGPKFKIEGQSEQPPIATVTGRIGCSGPIMADHFAFPPAENYLPHFSWFAALVAQRYPEAVAIESWNEPNLWAFWRPQPDPGMAARLTAWVNAGVDLVDPGMPVILGGLSPLLPSELEPP